MPAKIIEEKIISHPRGYCEAWPTLVKRSSGELTLVYSGGRDSHICPFGRIEMMVSHDDGETWSWPRIILDSDIDDRDAGIVETSCGTLLVTTFSHSYYEDIIRDVEKGLKVPFMAEGQVRGELLVPERLPFWRAARDRVGSDERKAQTGEWVVRSIDGSRSWSPQYRCLVTSPHGPTLLRDGRIIHLGKEFREGAHRIGACESKDDGMTWDWLAEIPEVTEFPHSGLHELHAVEASDGSIVAHIRNHNVSHKFEILQSISTNGGHSWSNPHPTGVWGFPSHLLRMQDNRLLMTYSYRRAPYGICARFSNDNGKTWSNQLMVSADCDCPDFGYPSTVELSSGILLTVWYEARGDSSKTVLRQAKWTFAEDLSSVPPPA